VSHRFNILPLPPPLRRPGLNRRRTWYMFATN
jgi:hypothetical protein